MNLVGESRTAVLDRVRIAVIPQLGGNGPCQLCGSKGETLAAVVTVEHEAGGFGRFEACSRCAGAARRITAAPNLHEESGQVSGSPENRPPNSAEVRLNTGQVFLSPDERSYTVWVRGALRPDDFWVGWVEFEGANSDAHLTTGQETTQKTREAFAQWAARLEPAFLKGAFERASEAAKPVRRTETR